MKQEMELAMKLLEKDIHEKQVGTDLQTYAILFLSDFQSFICSSKMQNLTEI